MKTSTLRTTARNVSGFLFLTLLCWVLFMGLMSSRIHVDWNIQDYLNYAFNGDILFYMTYTNALLFTLLASLLFIIIYLVFSKSHPLFATTGILFIPIYAAFNMVSYGSQCLIIPILQRNYHPDGLSASEMALFSEWIQMMPGSVIGMINGMGYAILGISSVCFGLILYNEKPGGKIISLLLIANAIACFLGVIGMAADIPLVDQGVIVGGMLFTLAIPFLIYYFHKTSFNRL